MYDVCMYAASVWAPHQVSLVNKLEMAQKRATRFVSNDYATTSSVMSVLNSLEWPSLQQSRRLSGLILFHKAIHHEVAVDIPPCVNQAVRFRKGTTNHFLPLQCRTKEDINSYIPNTIIDWNNFPSETINQTTSQQFKIQEDKEHQKQN